MKMIPLLLLYAIFFSSNANAQKLEISQLTKNVFVYTTYKNFNGQPFPANGLYLVTDAGIVLIDTPWDETQFEPLLDSIEKKHHKKPVLCIATHSHDDRTNGLEYYKAKGIKTFTTTLTRKLGRINKEKEAEFTFATDTVFSVGGQKIETFYPGKGHTADNIVIWLDTDKILFGGCFIKSTESAGLGNLADADVKAWPKSIQKVIAKFPKPAFVIPGHYGWSSNQGLQHTLRLLGK